MNPCNPIQDELRLVSKVSDWRCCTVLHRHGGLQPGDQDVYLNAVGGVRVEETSSDLAVLLAVISR